MAIYQLPTGTYETRAAFAVRGGSFRDKRHFAATAILVQHPKGDLLIDAGFGSDLAAHVAELPRMQRAPHHSARTVSEQLDAAGYDRSRLLGVLVTHSHWDHVSGLDDLRVPIWINSGERHYAADDAGGKVFRAVSKGHEIHEYELNGPPYLGFPASFDVYGDGSVVIALAGGHTTGSVVVFVTVPSGQRYAFIGDLTWQLDGILRRVERPLLIRKLADSDPEQVRQGLLRVIALAGMMQIVPAHDRNAYKGIPRLPAVLPACSWLSLSEMKSRPDWTAPMSTSVDPSVDSEITWLLHRAAQRMHAVTGEQAEKYGIQLRDYIVLSALDKTPNLTQVELGKALGLDRTTLMTQLDRLERMGFVVRRSDPRDRRTRIPEITAAGNALRAKVARACDSSEAAALNNFSQDQVQIFRRMLFDIIGDSEDRGSCL